MNRPNAAEFLGADHSCGFQLAEVLQKGVEILAYQAEVTPVSIEMVRSLPVKLAG